MYLYLNEIIHRSFEKIHLFLKDGQLKSSICINNTQLSPKISFKNTTVGPIGLGGIRWWMYETSDDFVDDSVRLADGMTKKAALARLKLGGAKMVVRAWPYEKKDAKLYKFLGRCINAAEGHYFGGEDMGINEFDVQEITKYSPFVFGRPKDQGGSGNPKEYTKNSIFRSIEALLEFLNLTFEESSFIVQGIGSVGWAVVEELYKRKAKKVVVSDVDARKISMALDAFPGIETSSPYDPAKPNIITTKMEIFQEGDIFVPCARGGILNEHSMRFLKFRGICGSANNQCLCDKEAGEKLHRKGIVYVPDFLANNGGLINVADELEPDGYNENRVNERIAKNYPLTKELLEKSRREKRPPVEIAIEMAEDFIEKNAERPPRAEKVIKIHNF